MKPNFLNKVQIYVFDNFITEYQHGKKPASKQIKFDYT